MDNRESVGVVSDAYFVGRAALLQWINDLTHLNYSHIEQTASGIFACQVFDALYPGRIRLDKVKFNARQQYEYIQNYKVLQACFDSVGMKRQIDVEKLVKGKYQDNLEFMQWVKAYYDSHACETALQYKGRARREEVVQKQRTMRKQPTITKMSRLQSTTPAASSPKSPSHQKSSQPSKPPARPRAPLYGTGKAAVTSANVARSQANVRQDTALRKENTKLKADVERLQVTLDDSEAEREFYFNKLRKVELILQEVGDYENEDSPQMVDIMRESLAQIKAALYAEDDEEAPDEEAYVQEGPYVDDAGPHADLSHGDPYSMPKQEPSTR